MAVRRKPYKFQKVLAAQLSYWVEWLLIQRVLVLFEAPPVINASKIETISIEKARETTDNAANLRVDPANEENASSKGNFPELLQAPASQLILRIK